MTRTLFVCFTIFTICFANQLQGQEYVQWRYDLEQAKKIAGDEDKLILLHFSASWCGPCKELDRFVFVNPMAIRAISNKVVPVKIDVDLHGQIATEYEIRSVPTDVIVTPAGHVIAKRSSPRSADGYIEMIEEANLKSNSLTSDIILRSAELKQKIAEDIKTSAENHPFNADDSTNNNSSGDSANINSQPLNSESDSLGGGGFKPTSFSAPIKSKPTNFGMKPKNNGFQLPSGGTFAPPEIPSAKGVTKPSDWQAPETSPLESLKPPTAPIDQIQLERPNADFIPKTQFLTSQSTKTGSAQTANVQNQFKPSISTAGKSKLASSSSHPSTANVKFGGPKALTKPASQKSATVKNQFAVELDAKTPQIGLEGFCPVTLINHQRWVKGDKRWGCFHRGRLYLFVSKEKRNKFQATPDMFSPLLGGADPIEYHQNGKLIDGLRSYGVFYGEDDGPQLIVLFKNQANRDQFESEPGRFLKTVRQAMSLLDRNTLLR